MRLLAIGLVLLAAALAAGAGVIAEALPGARRFNEVDTCGMVLGAIATAMFVYEWWTTRDKSADVR